MVMNETTMSEQNKDEVAKSTLQYLIPLITKYEITDTNSVNAIIEAFQAGIEFSETLLREARYARSK